MDKSVSTGFPLRDVWLTIVPCLPLIALTILLSSLIRPELELQFLLTVDKPEEHLLFVSKITRNWIHLADILVYYSLGSFHTILSLGIISYYYLSMRKLPRIQYTGSRVFLAVISALLVALVAYYALNSSRIVLTQLGFKAVCEVIREADLATSLTGTTCSNSFSKLTLLAWVPAFAGMITVAFAASYAYGIARELPSYDDCDWRAAIDQRIKALRRSVYALSTVLVSSTLAITMFSHLPTGLLDEASGQARAVSAYAAGVSTFWGALFSLTLMATFAVPAVRILRHTYGYRATGTETAIPQGELQTWLHEHVFVSFRNQFANVFSLMAPLLVGPLSSLISSLVGA